MMWVFKIRANNNAAHDTAAISFYAAVIDAGSTGTRLHLFHSIHNGTDVNPNAFRIESETFLEVKPGLSAFADAPDEAAAKVRVLINKAKDVIPENLWQSTPVTLKATAGLRLLKNNQAENILASVSDEISKNGFLMFNEAIGIMPGVHEGVFAWFTLNILTNRVPGIVFNADTESLPKMDINSTAAAMDLGGGSTQLTFLPKNKAVFEGHEDEMEDYSFKTSFFNKEMLLYSHSYLGNGLVAARLGISQLHSGSEDLNLKTYCFPASMKIYDWEYGSTKWQIEGVADGSFENCLKMSLKYVKEVTKVKKMPEMNEKDIYGFSYFYDRGIQAKIIPASERQLGGYIKVSDYKAAAIKACQLSTSELGPEHWKPWQCQDLTYIYTLLHYGYGLNNEKQIYLAKKLRGMEMSWALGASYNLLKTYFETFVANN
uniref:Nucleoside phosphatase GDA1/CD39 n=1 Tax=Rhabditophanes sp. KR3021 TaxID=114890 RepID=A0AC35U3T9_9BILA